MAMLSEYSLTVSFTVQTLHFDFVTSISLNLPSVISCSILLWILNGFSLK